MAREDHSSYCSLFVFAGTSAANSARAILDWCAALGVSKLMSDGKTHFKNETLRLVAKSARVLHHFTKAYTPLSDGADKRLDNELLLVFWAVLSEQQMRPEKWSDLLPLVQSVLNNILSTHSSGIILIQVITGWDATTTIRTSYSSSTFFSISVSAVAQERVINSQRICEKMEELCPMIQKRLRSNKNVNAIILSKGHSPTIPKATLFW